MLSWASQFTPYRETLRDLTLGQETLSVLSWFFFFFFFSSAFLACPGHTSFCSFSLLWRTSSPPLCWRKRSGVSVSLDLSIVCALSPNPVYSLCFFSFLLHLLSCLQMLYTRVFFRAVVRTDFGERVAVVGSSPALGNWQAVHCHELTTNEDVFPSWFSKEPVYLPLKKRVFYKYVILDERGEIVRWEDCEGNREVVPTGVEMTVEDDDGLFREQMTNRGDHGVEGDDDVSVTAADKEETEARNRVLAIQEEEPAIDENDTLVVLALDLPLRVVRVSGAPAASSPDQAFPSSVSSSLYGSGCVSTSSSPSPPPPPVSLSPSSPSPSPPPGEFFSPASPFSLREGCVGPSLISSSSHAAASGYINQPQTAAEAEVGRGGDLSPEAGGGASTGDPEVCRESQGLDAGSILPISSTRQHPQEDQQHSPAGGRVSSSPNTRPSPSGAACPSSSDGQASDAVDKNTKSGGCSTFSSSEEGGGVGRFLFGEGSHEAPRGSPVLGFSTYSPSAAISSYRSGANAAHSPPPLRSSRGTFEVRPSKSALLPSLYQLRNKTRLPVRFIGWPGVEVDDELEQQELIDFLRPYDCVPIFPEKTQFHQYQVFCHMFLWPLFHNVVILDSKTQVPFDTELWSCYQAVNKLWADAVLRHAHESDMIWVHDYHLLLAPMHIARKVRKANVGFFLHIPFPSSEIFRCLPCREDILRGMLCADLIGFHLFEYARHFLVACKRLLGLEHHFCRGGILSIEYGGRNVSVRIGHVHIQYDVIRKRIEGSPTVQQMARDIRQKYTGKFIFVSVDRCERLAGLLLKVRAFQKFLSTYAYARGNVVLIQYAYPTINYSGDSESMREDLVELVDKVNTQFALPNNPDFKHIDLLIQPVAWEEKCAVFIAGDCFLDTSIRDGLNLNPFEYICCHKDNVTGVILSEFTGCSRALASAIRVNPWKVEAVADAMDRIINMPIEEQRDRFMRDQDYLNHNSTQKWAEENILDLRRARKPDDYVYVSWGLGTTFRVLGMDSNFKFLDTGEVLRAFRTSRHRIFFFDCEGTLAPDRRRITFVPGGENLFAQGRPPSQHVKDCLQALVNDGRNTVVILSGRDRHLLEEWFEPVKGIGLCAEHGFYYRVPGITGDQWHCMSRQRDFTWKQVAIELMLQYVKRTQGSFIENKGSALVFQYRDADPDFGSMQAKDLSNYLSELLFGYPVSVMSGKGYVEVKLRGVNKGHAVEKVLRKLSNLHGDVDFILCVGDDRSDEDMFAVINAMTEDGDQVSLPEGSGAGSSGLYRHPQPKDRILRRCSVSSDENCFRMAGGAPPHHYHGSSSRGELAGGGDLGGGPGAGSGGGEGLKRSGSSNAGSSGGLVAAGSGSNLAGKKKSSSHFFTCTVGKKPSNARYYLGDTDDVSDLLESLRQATEKDSTEKSSSFQSVDSAAAAAAAVAGSLAGNAAVQLRKGDSGGIFSGFWMRSTLCPAAVTAPSSRLRSGGTLASRKSPLVKTNSSGQDPS